MEIHSDKYQLCVLEGAQQGSRQALRLAQEQTIGNSFDCDIYLHDDSEAEHQVKVLPGRFSIGITLLSGDAVLDSKPMVLGQKYKLNPGTPVRLGESLFALETLRDQPSLAAMPLLNSRVVAPESGELPEQELSFEEAPDAVVPGPGLIHRIYRPGFIVLLIGIGLTGSVFVAWRSGPLPVALTPVAAVQASMPVAQLPVAADIENSVVDVFRTYGVNAEASSIRAGVVKVVAHSTDTQKLAAAEASAIADVYGLKELIVDYDQPETQEVVPPKKVVSKSVDQEIRMIVIGNPTYVVDNNQSRYFKGSKLPTGHRVADIQKGLVVVEKNGVTTELKL